MLRVVADTNIVVSALLWHGAPYRVFAAIESATIDFYTSSALLDELANVLQRHKLQRAVRATGKGAQRLLQEYEAVARIVKPGRLPARVSRDPDDDSVLACAVAARADFIVTGDKDLLGLRAYGAIAILTASEALDRILQRP